MFDSFARLDLKKLFTISWMVFLCYGPVALFIAARFEWQLLAINQDSPWYISNPALVSALCALVMAVVFLFRLSWKMILYAVIFILDLSLGFSPLVDILETKSFADYIKPEPAYVQKHCAPINFVQDGKTYSFGVCDLIMDNSGQMSDFSFIYDSSGDVGNYDDLSKDDKIIFRDTVRKYFSDNPNEQFENAYFIATRYYQNFYYVSFDAADAEGFVRDFGRPPENSKNPYPPMFW
jgi:hypothetical protein